MEKECLSHFIFKWKNIFSYFISYLVIFVVFPSKYSIYPVLKNILSIFLYFLIFVFFQYFTRPVSKIGLNWLNRGKNRVKTGVLKIFQLLFFLKKNRIENLPYSIYLRMTIYIYIYIYIYIDTDIVFVFSYIYIYVSIFIYLIATEKTVATLPSFVSPRMVDL